MRSRIAGRLFDEAQPAQRIAHYEILRKVGSGGMGVVYAARDTKLDRKVALKLVRRMSELGHERLTREARILAKLSHPNIVQVYEVGEHEGDVHVAMELVEGETVRDWRARAPRSIREILEVFRAAGAGLVAAHAAGIIHRDFKPSNVLVGADGRVRVADFGLARPLPEDTAPSSEPNSPDSPSGPPELRTSMGLVGTPGYIAPELLDGSPADERSDQFALCVSLAEALTGARPEAGASIDLGPRWLRRAVARGLAVDPGQRWPSVAEFVEALDRRPQIRRRSITALVAGGVLGGLGLAGVMQSRNDACLEFAGQFDQVWTAERQREVRAHLEGGGAEWTAALALELEQELAAQRESWVEVRGRVCRAALISEGSEELGLADDCLDRHLERIDALIELVLATPPRQLLELDEQLEELGEPGDCRAGSRLLASPPPPEFAAEIREIEAGIDKLRLTITGGDHTNAADEVARLVARAEATGYSRVVAEALSLRARIELERGQPHAAAESGYRAALAAEAAGDDELVFFARRELVDIYAEELDDPDRARLWYEHARASFSRLGSPVELEIPLLDASSELAIVDGELERAKLELERAIELALRLDGEHPRVDRLRLSLANLLADRGESEAAIELYEAVGRRRRALLGAEHPGVATLEFNLGLLRFELGEFELAEAHLRRALAIQEQAFGVDAPQVLPTLSVLAQVVLTREDYSQIIGIAERMIPLEQAAYPVTEVRRYNGSRLLAHAHLQLREYERALDIDTSLVGELGDALGPELRANLELEIGWLRCRLGACNDDAREHFEAATRSPDEHIATYAAVGLAQVELAAGNPEAALAILASQSDAVMKFSSDDHLTAEFHAARAIALSRAPSSSPAEISESRRIAEQRDLPPDLADLLRATLGAP